MSFSFWFSYRDEFNSSSRWYQLLWVVCIKQLENFVIRKKKYSIISTCLVVKDTWCWSFCLFCMNMHIWFFILLIKSFCSCNSKIALSLSFNLLAKISISFFKLDCLVIICMSNCTYFPHIHGICSYGFCLYNITWIIRAFRFSRRSLNNLWKKWEMYLIAKEFFYFKNWCIKLLLDFSHKTFLQCINIQACRWKHFLLKNGNFKRTMG